MINRINSTNPINRVRFTPNSERIITAAGHTVKLWSAKDRGGEEKNLVKTITLPYPALDAASNPGANLIAVRDSQGTITCWSPEPYEPSAAADNEAAVPATAAAELGYDEAAEHCRRGVYYDEAAELGFFEG